MHPIFSNSNVPAFLVKLWKLVSDPATDDLIAWNHNGSSFFIVDPDRFAKELLPQYFKHSNNASFIRQLNIYGFRKVMHYLKPNCYKEDVEFQHPFFLKDKVELLTNIKRKNSTPKSTEPNTDTSFTADDILSNLSTLREKQRIMDTTLTKMKKENEILWRELSTVRQRHKAREQVLHKVIQFLVQLIQRSNQSIHVPRKLARMLQNSPVSQENSSQVARIVEVLGNNDSDHMYAPDEAASPVGAVIHEVTDFDSSPSDNFLSSSDREVNISVLKPELDFSESNNLSFNSSSSEKPSSLDHLSIHEDLQNRPTSTFESASNAENPCTNLPVKYIAVPVQDQPNQLILIPADNFAKKEVSNLKLDSSSNAIPLPGKEAANSTSRTLNCDSSISVNSITSDCLKRKFNTNSKLQLYNSSEKTSDILNNDTDNMDFSCESYDSFLTQQFDDSALSDLLQASKISSVEEEQKQISPLELNAKSSDSSFDKDSFGVLSSTESCNNQVAIPGPSSIVKSTKACFPDLSNLQESVNSTSNLDMKLLEQLFSADDTAFSEPSGTQLPTDVNMSTSSDDIIGKEIVQFSPAMFEDDEQLHLYDFLNQESYFTESDMNSDFFCAPKDTDVLLGTSDNNFSSTIEALQKETLLLSPKEGSSSVVTKPKRRKVK